MRIWRTACPDWQERMAAGRSLVPDLPLYEAEAAKAVRIFDRLRVPDVIGKPTLGVATGDWFRDIVRALFGSYDPETHVRHLQEVFLLVPKKNGKTTNAAAVMLTAAIMNRRPEVELMLLAPTKEIASISYSQASGMIRADTALDTLFYQQSHIRTITHRVSGAVLKIVAADTDTVTGSKAAYTLVDEVHEFARKPRAQAVYIEIRGALAARPDGFFFQISTQSKQQPGGVFLAEVRRARQIRDGEVDLPTLPVLYELPKQLSADDGWKKPEHWRLVNPSLGRSLNVDFLHRGLKQAEQDGIEALALFASQHFNVEIGVALRTNAWAGARHWAKAADPTLSLKTLLERSEVVVLGVDGGGLDDLLGLAVLGKERDTNRWLLWSRAWAVREVLELRKSEAARLLDFVADGDLVLVDDILDANAEVAAIAKEVEESGLLAQTGLDPWGTTEAVDALSDVDIEGDDRVVGVQQGWKLNGAIKTGEIRLANGSLVHAAQALMAWCVGNALTELKGNAVTITKQLAGVGKIDPLIALFVAIALMVRNPKPQGGAPSIIIL